MLQRAFLSIITVIGIGAVNSSALALDAQTPAVSNSAAGALPAGLIYEVSAPSAIHIPPATGSLADHPVPLAIYARFINNTDNALKWTVSPHKLRSWQLRNAENQVVGASPAKQVSEPGLAGLTIVVKPHSKVESYEIIPLEYKDIVKGGQFKLVYTFWGFPKESSFQALPETH